MNVPSRLSLLAASVAVSAALLCRSTNARADIAPPNTEQCQGKAVATSCVTEEGTDGTCQETMCDGHEAVDAGDGGIAYVAAPYACAICTAQADASAADGGATTTTSTSSSSGCNVGSTSTGSALSFAGLGLALALVLRKATRRAR